MTTTETVAVSIPVRYPGEAVSAGKCCDLIGGLGISVVAHYLSTSSVAYTIDRNRP